MSKISGDKSTAYRFESEVHVGMLLIIFLLLCLTFVSNFVIHKSRSRLLDQWSESLESASLSITRHAMEYFPKSIPDSLRGSLCNRYKLGDIVLVPTRPSSSSPQAKRQWIASVVSSLPPDRLTDLADKLFGANFGELTRSDGDSYFLISASLEGRGYPFVIVTAEIPGLAYLETSSRTILIFSVVAILVVGGLYLYVSRFIFSPFRKIRQQAARAGRPIPDQRNEAEAVVVEYQKIIDDLHENQTELLRLNAAIKVKADTLQQFNEYVLNSTESGVMTLDLSGRILALNTTAARLLAIEHSSCIGCNYAAILSSHHPLNVDLDEVIRSGHFTGYREEQWDKHAVGVSMSFVRNDAGAPVGLWILLFDLTEVAALRSELESKNRLSALGEMAGGLAHQLRNSMGAMSGYGSLVKKNLPQSSPQSGYLESLIDEIRQTDQLIKRFLSFARPLEFDSAVLPLDATVEEIIESFRVRSDFANITIHINLQSGAMARIDLLLFKQALGNLIENAALAYVDKNGSVEVATTLKGDEATITVSDQGAGIEQDKLDRVFTPFYSSRPSGTGLGLPLAARIIDMHHGSLSLVSQLGTGTTATIVLPVIACNIDSPTPRQVAVIS